jgi:hypothetical protein
MTGAMGSGAVDPEGDGAGGVGDDVGVGDGDPSRAGGEN